MPCGFQPVGKPNVPSAGLWHNDDLFDISEPAACERQSACDPEPDFFTGTSDFSNRGGLHRERDD
jgi:hypothetical protein